MVFQSHRTAGLPFRVAGGTFRAAGGTFRVAGGTFRVAGGTFRVTGGTLAVPPLTFAAPAGSLKIMVFGHFASFPGFQRPKRTVGRGFSGFLSAKSLSRGRGQAVVGPLLGKLDESGAGGGVSLFDHFRAERARPRSRGREGERGCSARWGRLMKGLGACG